MSRPRGTASVDHEHNGNTCKMTENHNDGCKTITVSDRSSGTVRSETKVKTAGHQRW